MRPTAKIMNPRQSLEERFFSKVNKRGPEACWLWKASVCTSGYGQFAPVGKKLVLGHRFAWALTNGPIPKGMRILHRCDTPACCNPAHLFVGTDADNVADKTHKGRASKKLTEANVREIVAEADKGARGNVIARRFGVSPTTVHKILRGYDWSHVTNIQPLRRAA